ncbi:MAG: nitroreductase family protein [Bacteroidales bacterium]|nr:nitroreductase family protein [Bacteroidales bacterium]MDD4656862.1 nitroreductase family protein [Bacteroidales bacterium]
MIKKVILLSLLLIITQNRFAMAQNPTLETIFSRKSVRSYTDEPVSNKDLTLLVKAGMAAPSGMNKQPWEFLVIKDRAKMVELSNKLPYALMMKDAQALIVVIGNPKTSAYWYLDCSAAAQNILLAAESIGLGAVWTAGYPYEDRMETIASELSIPKPYRPLCVIPIGYPKGEQTPKNKWKEEKLHMNKW